MQKYKAQQVFNKGIKGYFVDGKFLPGVTTVLQKTQLKKSQIKLQEWRQKIGYEQAKIITQQASSRGTKLHTAIKKYLQDEPMEIENTISDYWSRGTSLLSYIKTSSTILLIENFVWSSKYNYAGIVDCVAEVDGQITVFDWKSSLQKKHKDWISDYFLQVSAYRQAFSEVYGDIPEAARVIIFLPDAQPQTFEINSQELDVYFDQFLTRLDKFWQGDALSFSV